MIREYKIGPHNSTVNGNPGRDFDWSLFCWNGSEVYLDDCGHPGHPKEEMKAPLPFVDGSVEPGNCQYLHVPYKWAEDCKIYRIYPLDGMWTGRLYRGHRIKRQTAEKREDGWFWVLESGDEDVISRPDP